MSKDTIVGELVFTAQDEDYINISLSFDNLFNLYHDRVRRWLNDNNGIYPVADDAVDENELAAAKAWAILRDWYEKNTLSDGQQIMFGELDFGRQCDLIHEHVASTGKLPLLLWYEHQLSRMLLGELDAINTRHMQDLCAFVNIFNPEK